MSFFISQDSLTSMSTAQSGSSAILAQRKGTAQSGSSAILAQRQGTTPPRANTTSTEASPIPGQPTEEMFKAFFSPRSNQPYTGGNEQRPEHEGSQSKKSNHASMSIQASNNRHLYTNAEICQNRPEHSVTQVLYNDNDVAGESLKIGGMTHQDGKESVKDKKRGDTLMGHIRCY